MMSTTCAAPGGATASASAATARTAHSLDEVLERIRQRSFHALRVSGTAFGVSHAGYTIAVLTRDGAWSGLRVLIIALELVAIAMSWRVTERATRLGAGCYVVVLSIFACVLLWTLGMTMGTALTFALACVGAVVFLGVRAGWVAYGWVGASVVAYGVGRHLGWDPGVWRGSVHATTPILVRYSLALLGLTGMLLATVAVAVRGFEAATLELGESLARERAEQEARQAEEVERARLERRLQGAQRLESMGRLAGGIVHDFNNALAVILSCAGELSAGVAEDRRADVEAIAAAARDSSLLTRRLLSIARHDPGRPSVVDVSELLRSLTTVLRRALPKSITVVEQAMGARDAPCVLAHRADLEHALINLALNARDAMAQGGTLTLTCRSRELSPREAARHPGVSSGPFVEIAVDDTGSGIDPEVLPRIFEPLFTTKSSEEGTGLGLSSVHEIVRSYRGAIDVQTAMGRGTRFTLLLPATRPDSFPSVPPAAAGAASVRR
jgi:signal transduction histidine kinase